MVRPKIYIFGDSITEFSFADGGWGAALTNKLCRTADVVLRGYTGYNTRWTRMVLEKIFPPVEGGEDGGAPVLAVTVFFGANDACLPDRCSAFQHVPIQEYRENLRFIVSFLKKRWPNAIILPITPPPIDEDARIRYPYVENPMCLAERTNEAAGAYAMACIGVAEECGCPVLDLWTKIQQLPDWQHSCLSDGLHLSVEGNWILFEEVVMKLKEEGLNLDTLPADLPVLPYDMDFNNPLEAFQNVQGLFMQRPIIRDPASIFVFPSI